MSTTDTSPSAPVELTLVQEANLEKALVESKLAPEGIQSLRAAFAPFFTSFHSLALSAQNIPDTAPKAARAMRLELRKIRIAADKTRKDLKEESLLRSRALDGINNLLLYALTPIEKKMEDIENRELIEAEAKRGELRISRGRELSAYTELPAIDLGQLPEDQYKVILLGAKTAHENKLAEAQRIENERIANEKRLADERAKKEEADRVERERLRAENEKLVKAAEEAKKAKLAAEAKALKEKREAEAKAAAERKVIEDKAAADRAEAEAKAKVARDKAEAERKEADRIAKAKQAEADAKAKVERDAREALEAKVKADELARAKEAAAKAYAERMAKEKEEAEAEAVKAAPDKVKLQVLAEDIRALKLPTLTSKKGQAFEPKLKEQIAKFSTWLTTEAGKL